jgi:hypothetical protein
MTETKRKKIHRTVSLLESTEKSLLEAYNSRGKTCGIGAFIGDLVMLGLKLDEELNRRRVEAVYAVAGIRKPQAQIIPFRRTLDHSTNA